VTAKERNEAEKMYLRRIGREITSVENSENTEVVAKTSDDSNNSNNSNSKGALAADPATAEEKKKKVIEGHPRYGELSAKHAASMAPMGDGQSASSLGSDTINVTIHSLSAASCTAEPMSKRLPASLQIGRLKQMCKRVFKLDIDLQILHFKADKQSMLVALDDDDNSLAYFGVCDGAEIYMNEIDLKAIKREADAEAEVLKNKMAEQEEGALRMKDIQLESVEREKRSFAAAANK
jgi:hypothetical protein